MPWLVTRHADAVVAGGTACRRCCERGGVVPVMAVAGVPTLLLQVFCGGRRADAVVEGVHSEGGSDCGGGRCDDAVVAGVGVS